MDINSHATICGLKPAALLARYARSGRAFVTRASQLSFIPGIKLKVFTNEAKRV